MVSGDDCIIFLAALNAQYIRQNDISFPAWIETFCSELFGLLLEKTDLSTTLHGRCCKGQ